MIAIGHATAYSASARTIMLADGARGWLAALACALARYGVLVEDDCIIIYECPHILDIPSECAILYLTVGDTPMKPTIRLSYSLWLADVWRPGKPHRVYPVTVSSRRRILRLSECARGGQTPKLGRYRAFRSV